jgi:hypothetical protein
MVPFVEVFPLGLSLNFTFESAAWAADEQYCVQPKRTCTELVLSFLQLKDSGGTVATTVENVPACRYNYRSRALDMLVPGAAGTPPLSQLLTALHAAHPSLDVRLALHHRLMQSLYLRRKVMQIRTQLNNLGPQLPAAPPQIGRNAPCPCGSGKKYKKCRGA